MLNYGKKKTLQIPCTINLAQRRIQKDRDQSQPRRLLQGLIKQHDILTGQYQSSSGLLRYHEFTAKYMK